MSYLTKADEIAAIIKTFVSAKVLWADTEVADWNTPKPRLSLIQILSNPTDLTGNFAYILDVLDKPDLVKYFIDKIMADSHIEKVFHNASYDLKFLGNGQAKNVTCTWKLAKKIPKDRLQVTNLQLKTLAAELCQFTNIDKKEQGSDWGRRPLTEKQLQYAKLDPVYLAHVHRRLLQLTYPNHLDLEENLSMPQSENSAPIFSATKVRISLECPRLFYLGHHFDIKTQFIPEDNAVGIGQDFHQLADRFAHLIKQDSRFAELFELAAQQLSVEEIAAKMQQLIYELAFFPHLQTTLQTVPGKAAALHKVWQALRGLIQRWAELLVKNRRCCSATEVISKTFVDQELKVQHTFTLPNGMQQLVKGQFDSLIFDCEQQRLCVVEFKTYQPVDPSAQLAQVALYSYMLRGKKKVPVDSAVYCIAPEFKEYYYSWEQLENTVHQLIPHKLQQMRQWLKWESPQPDPPPPTTQPHLCNICPQREKCQTFFVAEDKSTPTPVLAPPAKPATPTPDADEMGKQLVNVLESFGIGVDYQGAAIAPAFIRVKLKPHPGVKVVSLLNRSADLQVQLGLANPPMIAPQAGYVSIDLPRSTRQVAKFEDYIHQQKLPPTAPVKIALGVNLDGQLVEADLSDPNTCHFLVGGTTGSGKSEFLRSLLLSLLWRHSPNHLKIALVDPKRVTFPEFEGMQWLYQPVVKDSDSCIQLMQELVAEMEQRYQRFEKSGCADVSAYNQKTAKPLPRLVCIFDEYADFMTEKEIRNALELSIKRLGAMARAAGIHLIIATQRPEAKVVTPLIRSNLPGRVALRTASEADSIIVLGGQQKAAAYLLGKGDLLYQMGVSLHRLQSLFAPTLKLPQS